MKKLVAWLDRTLYPAFAGNWDDALFRERILARLTREASVLDLGAGAGIVGAMNFKGLAKRVCGIDLDPRVVDNPYLDEGLVSDGDSIPYPDDSFDLVFADNVFEHLEYPEAVLGEINRVLRKGGYMLFKTPNRQHYMPMIARLTPHRFHQFVNRIRGRSEVDTFPTFYRANKASDVHALARKTGFEVAAISLIEGRPEYLRMTPPTYLAGAAYERLVNRFGALARFRILLIAELRKA
ncbi:MAG: class I SAM-dependent methyltransferase [Sphingomonas sp.]|uniref:class I SAM-dependent methyltransferase n=1 Tax=Sphingomonas sp. TaxID=28214 RepID=UPI0025CF683D|nr:class I SAM-dependent methyltransferase [Sphingomonas sp.]MBX3565270.1 class I SAM-dependent methyltransferase [Sphingomonas sp.]